MSAATRLASSPIGTCATPSKPQPFWRDTSLTIQLVTEPTVETPTLRPLRSSGGLDGIVGAHDQREQQRRPRHGGDALDRRALDDEGQAGPGAERDVDGVGRHRLLNAGVAAEARDLEVKVVLLEEAAAHADIGRHERERLAPGLADAQRVGVAGEAESAAMRSEQSREQDHRATSSRFVPAKAGP